MRSIFYILSAMIVIGLGYWAYHENYETQASLKDVRSLHRQIGAAHERLNILEAEWAYLNRPDRLRDLAELNFDRLGLLPLMPDAFGRVEQIAYPTGIVFDIANSVTVSSDNAPLLDTQLPVEPSQ
ncbi:cell division protein FtsL [Octadecabacter sp. 1_MG-2023]|uniref:cell division protein FtsL n=1 Tax=Octadecabacter TaxID=53945 RepID=UPI001C099AFC|nr:MULTISPECIES: cell division protein FtsL [Octadecabacter]MBU2992921.1 cell division protein FtsL [Octadecabacter sp. B2R22]MCF2904362.1 cell division protein FtsL [Octadecabacter algicola]MDO6733628.1 cell division protein FtsL [Octadecabacter sp. 1_MG-2023]